jgi:hypothetical protein
MRSSWPGNQFVSVSFSLSLTLLQEYRLTVSEGFHLDEKSANRRRDQETALEEDTNRGRVTADNGGYRDIFSSF